MPKCGANVSGADKIIVPHCPRERPRADILWAFQTSKSTQLLKSIIWSNWCKEDKESESDPCVQIGRSIFSNPSYSWRGGSCLDFSVCFRSPTQDDLLPVCSAFLRRCPYRAPAIPQSHGVRRLLGPEQDSAGFPKLLLQPGHQCEWLPFNKQTNNTH